MTPDALRALLDDIDLDWLDLLLRGYVRPQDRLLDAGCGMGRNLTYPHRAGVEVWGVDQSADDVAHLRRRATEEWQLPPDRFRVEALDHLSFPDAHFDAICCCLVLHFARDDAHFADMLRELWRVLRPGGLLFTKLAVHPPLPDQLPSAGSKPTWHLTSQEHLHAWTARLSATPSLPLRVEWRAHEPAAVAVWPLRKSSDMWRADAGWPDALR